ncbi:hypothetical protein [Tissierella praeacuta]|uniref:hypothetical protein n=1 Tax=Tissierella praeacuta TaxID=43131 RepID=UPI0028A2052D|nr:hypothetical protein [Tissierella praeacuta]
MNLVQERLVKSYATLVMAEIMKVDEVPDTKKIGSIEYPIKSEVDVEIAKRTIEILG